MIRVYIENQVKAPFRYKHLYKKLVKELITVHNISGDTEVNLILTDNEGIRKISKQYKKKDKATDVLSFPAGFREVKPLIGYNMLGDIYISYEKIQTQAKLYGHSEKREWAYLFAHGLLHLIGYDHMVKKEEDEMNSFADDMMKKVGVDR